jgi:hypothetical protein
MLEKAKQFLAQALGGTTAAVDIAAKPAEFSVGLTKVSPERHMGRLYRLYQALADSPSNAEELMAEIDARRKALADIGVTAPQSLSECQQLLEGTK